MHIVRYKSEYRQVWDTFVDASKNGTFLFKRDFMEYHADRFEDCSFLFMEDEKPVALLPGNIRDRIYYSHQGLTYGGFIMSNNTKAEDPLLWMKLLVVTLREMHVEQIIYKSVPHIYHTLPAEEDLYALFRFGANLSIRNLSTVIPTTKKNTSSRLKRAIKRSKKENLIVEECHDASCFWEIIEDDRMDRHQVKPVHSCEEINLLHDKFPENVRLFITHKDDKILAGSVIFDTGIVTHLQYAAATPEGKDLYATDILYYEFIYNIFPENIYFDFGISNEDKGKYLNTGMTAHKEEFGGHSVVYDIYEIKI